MTDKNSTAISRAVNTTCRSLCGLLFLTLAGRSVAQEEAASAGPNQDGVYHAAVEDNTRLLSSLRPVTDSMLREPSDADWLAWRRTEDGAGYSPLAQVSKSNVSQLHEKWSWNLALSPDEITPMVHDGVMYIASGDRLQALDAVKGTLLWEYQRPLPELMNHGEMAIVKNLAIYEDHVFWPTPDGHMVALQMKTGKVVWDHEVLNSAQMAAHLGMVGGPLIASGKVIEGVSRCFVWKGGCFIVALDVHDGHEAWRLNTIARPGEEGGDSWNGAPLEERFGGAVWEAGTYDRDLNLVYFGVGQTYDAATLLQSKDSKGASANALYTDSTLAINPDTGKIVWHYQHFQTDTWDFDWAFERTLFNLTIGGEKKKLLITGGKIGIFDTLDRTNGSYQRSKDLGLQNLVTSIDPTTGVKTIDPALKPQAGKVQSVCPHSGGARSWLSTAYDPQTHLLYVPLIESCMDYEWVPRDAAATRAGGVDFKWSLKPRPDSDGMFGRVAAIDVSSGKTVWTKRQRAPQSSSILATGAGLIFEGDRDRYFRALDAATGRTLWETRLNSVPSSSPITYAVKGRQYVAVVAGGGGGHDHTWGSLVPEISTSTSGTTLWIFSLPDTAEKSSAALSH